MAGRARRHRQGGGRADRGRRRDAAHRSVRAAGVRREDFARPRPAAGGTGGRHRADRGGRGAKWCTRPGSAARGTSPPRSSSRISAMRSRWSRRRTAASRCSPGRRATTWCTRTASRRCCCEARIWSIGHLVIWSDLIKSGQMTSDLSRDDQMVGSKIETCRPRPVRRQAPCNRRSPDEGFAFVHGADMRDLLAPHGSLADWTVVCRQLEPSRAGHLHGRWRPLSPPPPRRLRASPPASAIVRQPHQPHIQTLEYNPMNGGIERWFEPIDPAVGAGASMHDDPRLLPVAVRHAGAVAARLAHRSAPVPDRGASRTNRAGRRRKDCTATASTTCWCCSSIGATSPVASPRFTRPMAGALGHFTLTDPFDAALVDDSRVAHGVTPVAAIDPQQPAYRDVLVVTFASTAPDLSTDRGTRSQEGAMTLPARMLVGGLVHSPSRPPPRLSPPRRRRRTTGAGRLLRRGEQHHPSGVGRIHGGHHRCRRSRQCRAGRVHAANTRRAGRLDPRHRDAHAGRADAGGGLRRAGRRPGRLRRLHPDDRRRRRRDGARHAHRRGPSGRRQRRGDGRDRVEERRRRTSPPTRARWRRGATATSRSPSRR